MGSIKTNIGHTEGSSGLAGVIKGVLSLEHGAIAPNRNYESPNPEIDLEGWNLRVPTKLMPWPTKGLRRMSVNSFGFGGTNAHVSDHLSMIFLNHLLVRLTHFMTDHHG